MPQNLRSLNGSFGGLAEKVKFARRVYRESFAHPEVRSFAENAAGQGSRLEQARRLFSTLKNTVRYYGDPIAEGSSLGVEMMKAPWIMVQEIKDRGFAAGDCDDQATLSYALLKSIGIPAALRVVWFNGAQNPKHIYSMANISGQWTAFDTVSKYMGFERAASHYEDFL